MVVLAGRDRELQLIRDLVDVGPLHPRGLVLIGDGGSGKSTLLAEAARVARDRGRSVISISGRTSAVHPIEHVALVLGSHVPALDLGQREVIAGAGRESRASVIGPAVLALLTIAAEEHPLLITVDDADRLDPVSLEVLSFVSQRCRPEHVSLLLAVGGLQVPAGFDRTLPELYLEALDDADASRVIEQLEVRLDAGQIAQVLAQAAGNPLALVELANALERDPSAAKRWPGEPLPIGARIAHRVMKRVDLLPAETRFALLVAAVEDSIDGSASVTGGVFATNLAVFEPAERDRLIQVDRTGVRFAHPLVRAAIYHAATFAERAEAHRWVAEAVTDRPDLRAWHLAAGALGPEESLAGLLEQSVPDAVRRGGGPAAGRALERAAELSPRDDERARRYLAAAKHVAPTGDASWVEHLAQHALDAASRLDLRAPEHVADAWVMGVRGRFTAAAGLLSSATEELTRLGSDEVWDVLGITALVGYQSGAPDVRDRTMTSISALDSGDVRLQQGPLGARRVLIDAYLSPSQDREQLIHRLNSLVADRPSDLSTLGRLASAAWFLDETATAVTLAESAIAEIGTDRVDGSLVVLHSVLAWALYDAGFWDRAHESAQLVNRLSLTQHGRALVSSSEVALATIAAARGDQTSAELLARRALAAIPPNQSRAVEARAYIALGVAAASVGEHTEALWHLRHLFHEDGSPLHWHVSYLGIADLAAAASRAGEVEEARARYRKIRAYVPADPSPRISRLLAHAQALIAEPAEAEVHFRAATSGIEGRRWPFDYARAKLDHGAWLRRQRRVGEAGLLLESARERFRDLGASPWRLRAEGELRASSVSVPGIATSPSSLTAQQWEIVQLAGAGMTNREIADRLFLSPRTVGSHLYRSFPKLGVTHRGQLRAALDALRRSDFGAPPASDRA